MADVHHAGIEWTLVPENWSGRVEVISAVDGRVSNAGVARYQQLERRHLDPVSPRTLGPEVIALKAETRQSNLYIRQAARTRVFAAISSSRSSGGCTRWRTISSRSWPSTCSRVCRRGWRRWWRSTRRGTRRSATRW
jgi:Glycosyl hydrolase family 65, N-terminal domain